MRKARDIYNRERQQAEEQGEDYATIDIELKLVRSNIKAVNEANKETEAHGIWIHAGRKCAILAEKLVMEMEHEQDGETDESNGRILDRNLRVIRPPEEMDPELYNIINSLKLNKINMETKQVNFLSPKLDRQVQLKDGRRMSLRRVLLDIDAKSEGKVFQHVKKEKRNNKVNLVFYHKDVTEAMHTI